MVDGSPAPHVCLVIGTRPELIKLAPVAVALRDRGARVHLLLTGQHRALDMAEAGLDAFACTGLACALDGLGPNDAVDAIAGQTRIVLRSLLPDWVVVQGDTTSALGGARAAAGLGMRLAHVEAGLRTGDTAQPWPEEPFRIEIDRLADVLFAPTQTARDHLLREGVRGRVMVTGNTGIDALRRDLARIGACLPDEAPHVLLTVHRRENLDAMPAIADGLARAARACAYRVLLPLHPNPTTAARARSR